jgi:excisionase family DNA binding protein
MATGSVVKLLTVVEAARELGISRSKLYELLADGELPSVRIGRTRRIAVAALEAFVADHTDRAAARSSA